MRRLALNTWPGMHGSALPSIEEFYPTDVTGLVTNAKPVLGVEVQRTNEFDRVGINTVAEEEYQVRYSVRVIFYLYSQSNPEGISVEAARSNAIRQRDDNMAILRACLLDRPSLGTSFLYLDENTLTEEYFQPTPVANNSQRFAIGGMLSADVRSDEQQAREALNDVTMPNVFTVDIEVVSLEDKLLHNVGEFPNK